MAGADDSGEGYWTLTGRGGEVLTLSDVAMERDTAIALDCDDPNVCRRVLASTGTLTAVVHWPDP